MFRHLWLLLLSFASYRSKICWFSDSADDFLCICVHLISICLLDTSGRHPVRIAVHIIGFYNLYCPDITVLGPKLLIPMGCVKLGETNCIHLPSVGEQTANWLPNFTQPTGSNNFGPSTVSSVSAIRVAATAGFPMLAPKIVETREVNLKLSQWKANKSPQFPR